MRSFDTSRLSAAEFEAYATQVATSQLALRKASPRCRLLNMHYIPDGFTHFEPGYASWDSTPNFKRRVNQIRSKLNRQQLV